MTSSDSREIFARAMRTSRSSALIPGTTPVISFGDFTRAHVATLGINPSSKEFLTGHAKPRLIPDVEKKRLEDFESLGIKSSSQIGEFEAARIWSGCQNYFLNNPYHWFNHFLPILANFEASYFDGSACHLDLVQSATSPVWGGLTKRQQVALLDEDLDFFRFQSAQPNIRVRLVNGRTAINQIRDLGICDLMEDRPILVQTTSGQVKCSTFVGRGELDELVLAWSANIPSLRGSNALKVAAAKKIGAWAASVN